MTNKAKQNYTREYTTEEKLEYYRNKLSWIMLRIEQLEDKRLREGRAKRRSQKTPA